MADWPLLATPGPVMISHQSRAALGVEMAAFSVAAPVSTAHGSANLARLFPFTLDEPYLVYKLWCHNGATVNGNVDVGIYSEDFTRIVSIGSTAQSGTNALQEFDITDTYLGRGRFYAALASSSGTATFFSNVLGIQQAKGTGYAQMASAFALPATITAAVVSAAIQPIFGLAGRTLVA